MDFKTFLRKYMPPLTQAQIDEIAEQAEAIIRAEVKAEEELTE